MYDVVCISDCCCDLIFSGLKHLPEPGTEVYSRELDLKAGGGANTPMGLGRLGCSVAYKTTIGDDSFGDIVYHYIESQGVSDEYILRPENSRTWATAVLSTSEDRSFVSYAGRDMALSYEEFALIAANTRHVHTYLYYVKKYPWIREICRNNNVTLSIDSTWQQGERLEDISRFVAGAFYTPNELEAKILTNEDDIGKALQKLSRICENVVITRGAGGCAASLAGTYLLADAPPINRVVDTTGAGDMFNAGLIYGIIKQMNSEDLLRHAVAAGTLAVTWAGGIDEKFNLPAISELAGKVKMKKL